MLLASDSLYELSVVMEEIRKLERLAESDDALVLSPQAEGRGKAPALACDARVPSTEEEMESSSTFQGIRPRRAVIDRPIPGCLSPATDTPATRRPSLRIEDVLDVLFKSFISLPSLTSSPLENPEPSALRSRNSTRDRILIVTGVSSMVLEDAL